MARALVDRGTWPRWRALATFLVACLWAGCDAGAGAAPAPSECPRFTDAVAAAHKRLLDLESKAPPPDAALAAYAGHCDTIAESSKEMAAAIGKTAVTRADLREAADGAKMLAELAAQRYEKLGGTVRELGQLGAKMEKLETEANDAISTIGPESAKTVGCETKTPAGCAALRDRLDELAKPPPAPFEPLGAAAAARDRGALLEALATAAEGVAAPEPKRQAQADLVKRARGAAASYRDLAVALSTLAPLSDRANEHRVQAEQAHVRLATELEAAALLCGKKLSSSGAASAPPPPSAHPSGHAR